MCKVTVPVPVGYIRKPQKKRNGEGKRIRCIKKALNYIKKHLVVCARLGWLFFSSSLARLLLVYFGLELSWGARTSSFLLRFSLQYRTVGHNARTRKWASFLFHPFLSHFSSFSSLQPLDGLSETAPKFR